MADDDTIGARIRSFRLRSGLPMSEAATRAGFSHASGLQRYVDPAYDKSITIDLAERLSTAFVGKGSPAIERAEIMALTGLPETNARVVPFEGASMQRLSADLPVYGTALGASRDIEGEAVEQTTLNRAETIAYAKRPVILNGRTDAYGLYVAGSSMDPVHLEGDLILIERKRPARIGDDVVVYLRAHGEEDDDGQRARAVLIKRLVRRTAGYVELAQFNPPVTFRIDAAEVICMDRVLRLGDLLS